MDLTFIRIISNYTKTAYVGASSRNLPLQATLNLAPQGGYGGYGGSGGHGSPGGHGGPSGYGKPWNR